MGGCNDDDLTMFDINHINEPILYNMVINKHLPQASTPLQHQLNTNEGMADYYNAYQAVWRNRYENEITKDGNQIKPIINNSV